MTKRLFALALCLMMLLSVVPAAGAAESTISVRASASEVKVGETFTITVTVNNLNNTSMSIDIVDMPGLEVVSGKWLISGMIAAYDPNQTSAVFSYGMTAAMTNGDVFEATLKATAPRANGYNVQIMFNAVNGATQLYKDIYKSCHVMVACASHTYGNFAYEDGTNHVRACTACGNPERAAHSWNAGVVTDPATCSKEGTKTYTCSVCSGTKTESIAKPAHNYSVLNHDGSQHWYECATCHTPNIKTNHTWNAGTVTTKPTCTKEGVKTFTCTLAGCGATKTESVDKIAHSWNAGTVTTKPTCSKKGVKTFTCTVCSGTKTEDVPTIGHIYGTWTKLNDTQHKRTCTMCTASETVAHSWNAGTVKETATCTKEGTKEFSCTACNATKTEKIPMVSHTYSTAEYNTTHHWFSCSACGNDNIKTPHTWNTGTVTTQPTCTTKGVLTKKCTGCNATTTEDVDVIPHKFTVVKNDNANHWHICSVCSTPDTDKTAHTWNAGTVTTKPTCTAEGVRTKKCTLAGCTATTTEVVDKVAHSFTVVKNDSTDHWHICSVCSIPDTDKTAHTWNAGTVTTKPTCTAEGVLTKGCTLSGCTATNTEAVDKVPHTYTNDCDTTCNVCGAVRTITHKYADKWSGDANKHWHACTVCNHHDQDVAHTAGEWVVVKEPQVLVAGLKQQKCTVCERVLDSESIPALECKHDKGTKEAGAKEPTCTENGQKANKVCAVCGYVMTKGEAISATGHTGEVKNVLEANCGQDGYTGDEICKGCGEKLKPGDVIPKSGDHSFAEGSCTVCGEKDPDYVAPTEPTPTEPAPTAPAVEDQNPDPQGNGTWIWWLVGGVLLILLLILLLLLKKRRDEEE